MARLDESQQFPVSKPSYLLVFQQGVNGWYPQLVLHLDWQQHIKVHTRHLAGPTGPVAKNPEQQHGKK